MANESAVKTPPYVSFTSFNNFLGHLREEPPLPPRIDKSVMRHLNYGTQQALLAALRVLGLVNKDDVPTDRLEKLVQAKENQRAPMLLASIKEGYPYFFDGSFDLGRATSDQFTEKIRGAGAGGSTAEKAISFFIAAATNAGVKLSPHLTKRKRGNGVANGSGPIRKASSKRPRHQKPQSTSRRAPQNHDVQEADGDVVNMLLAKFPQFDPKWEKAIQEKWFDGFSRLMNSAGLKEAKKP